MGPVSIARGSSPTTENAWNRALGVRPSCSALSADVISTAAAPSVSGEEFPGGDVPTDLREPLAQPVVVEGGRNERTVGSGPITSPREPLRWVRFSLFPGAICSGRSECTGSTRLSRRQPPVRRPRRRHRAGLPAARPRTGSRARQMSSGSAATRVVCSSRSGNGSSASLAPQIGSGGSPCS